MAKGDARQPQKSAAGTNKPPATDKPVSRTAVKPARMPKSSVAPVTPPALSSRTTTLDDPMTTSLLAEVSRHRSTVEIRPEDIEELIAADDAAAEADRDPSDGAP